MTLLYSPWEYCQAHGMSTTFVCDYVPSTKPQRVDAGWLLPAVHLRLLGPGKWLVLEEEIHVAGTPPRSSCRKSLSLLVPLLFHARLLDLVLARGVAPA